MRRVGWASRRQLRRPVAFPLAVAVAVAIAACGGGGHTSSANRPAAAAATPGQLVSDTVTKSDAVNSGRVALNLTIALHGISQLGGKPITLDVAGPFSRGAGNRLDADLSAALSIAGSTAHLGLVSAGGKSYLGINGTFYDLGAATATTGATGATGMLATLGIRPATWLSAPHLVGPATVGGVATEHLTAQINVANVLAGVSKVVAPTGATGSGASTSSTVLALIESAITNAQVDIYTGTADHIVRRFDMAISFTVPAIANGALGGLTGGSLHLDVTLSQLGSPQTVTAPVGAQPSSRLLNGIFALESQFGALAPLLAGTAGG
jgi:hypothetical protein